MLRLLSYVAGLENAPEALQTLDSSPFFPSHFARAAYLPDKMATLLVQVAFPRMRVRDQLIVHDVVYEIVLRKTYNDAFLEINVCHTRAFSNA